MKIIDADKLHYKTVRIATEKGAKPALVVFAKEIQKTKGLPIAERHGMWYDVDGCMTICSECHGYGCESPYCPNCGAKMDGVGYE